MTAAAIAVVAVLMVTLSEIRHRRRNHERREWLRYRAERRGVLL